jgi:3-phytase
MKNQYLLLLPAATAILAAAAFRVVDVQPLVQTPSMSNDVDDPAIWRNPKDPARSFIVATIKQPKPVGALAVFTLDGMLEEIVDGIDRPNNVDILDDICVVTERLARRIQVYRIHAEKPHLRLLGTVPAFAGEPGEAGAPMGIALYRRRTGRALFVIVSRKTGPTEGYLWQYRLQIQGDSASGEKVRAFGSFSGQGEIEAIAVDPQRELVYYSDENCCVRVYRADPDAPLADRAVARFAETGFQGNREGIAIAGKYVMVTDQLSPRSEYHIYDRSNRREIAIWRGHAESTDGLDATSAYMGPRFPNGFWVAMNNRSRNFQLYPFP